MGVAKIRIPVTSISNFNRFNRIDKSTKSESESSETVDIDNINNPTSNLSNEEFTADLIRELMAALADEGYSTYGYDLVYRNCNDFTERLCAKVMQAKERIDTDFNVDKFAIESSDFSVFRYPGYVNRLARLGRTQFGKWALNKMMMMMS